MNEETSRNEGSWLGLVGRVSVVTGAGRGIGAEIARQMAAAGAQVALLDLDGSRAVAVAEAIGAEGGSAVGLACDVSDAASVAAAAEAVAERLGGCQILVNNAAVIYADALMNIDLDKWNRLLSVNLSGYLLCAQAFGRQMMQQGGGSMIHVASISGSHPQPFSGPYSVSKAGVKMLSRLLSVEMGEQRVRSNVVSPAMIRTPLSEGIYADPEVVRRREEVVPARRISGPPDIANTVLFLASERSSSINGQDILVDGGLSQAWLTLVPRPGFEKSNTAPPESIS